MRGGVGWAMRCERLSCSSTWPMADGRAPGGALSSQETVTTCTAAHRVDPTAHAANRTATALLTRRGARSQHSFRRARTPIAPPPGVHQPAPTDPSGTARTLRTVPTCTPAASPRLARSQHRLISPGPSTSCQLPLPLPVPLPRPRPRPTSAPRLLASRVCSAPRRPQATVYPKSLPCRTDGCECAANHSSEHCGLKSAHGPLREPAGRRAAAVWPAHGRCEGCCLCQHFWSIASTGRSLADHDLAVPHEAV